MLRSTEIANLMTDIIRQLLPMNPIAPNHVLWDIEHKLQEWKLNIEWKCPYIGTDHSADLAKSILTILPELTDIQLAKEIEHVVTRYTANEVGLVNQGQTAQQSLPTSFHVPIDSPEKLQAFH